MTFIRWFLGKLILFFDRVFVAKPLIKRTPEAQLKVNQEIKSLSIYQFETCPFCVKVRRELSRLDVKIELRDARTSPYAEELKREGGTVQVPCLRIAEPKGQVRWMYESDDIIAYLRGQFGQTISSQL
jgi:glutaredoxin